MDKRFDKLEQKLDRISDDLFEIKVVQAEQAKDLKYHIKRTDLSEERLEKVEDQVIKLTTIKHKFDGAFKIIGMICSFAAFCLGVIKLFFG